MIYLNFNTFLFCLFNLISQSSTPAFQTTLVFPPFEHTIGFRKGTETHLKIFLKNITAHADDPQGISVVKLREKDDPRTPDDDDELTAYGVNSNTGQIIFNPNITSLSSFGKKGSKQGEFKSPKGISANQDGWVYVADYGNDRIVQLRNLNSTLKFISEIGKGMLKNPTGVALDYTGNIYVTDTGNNNVKIFNQKGVLLSTFSETFNSPTGIALLDSRDPWNFHHIEAVCIVDFNGKRIQKFDFNGNFLSSYSSSNKKTEMNFSYLAFDYFGNLYATDSVSGKIHIFDRNLKFITSFGNYGTGDREFDKPRGIAIWKRFGQTFILERKSAQYYWIGTDGWIENFEVRKGGVKFNLFVTQPSFITLEVHSEEKKISTPFANLWLNSGNNEIFWNGKDEKGKEIQKGEYKIKFILVPTYSSKESFKKILEIKLKTY